MVRSTELFIDSNVDATASFDQQSAYNVGAERLLELTRDLVTNEVPFVYEGMRQDDGTVISGLGENTRIYIIPGSDPRSDIARAVEADVYAVDTRWQQDREATEEYHKGLEEGSVFIVTVDTSDINNPLATGSIRVSEVFEEEDSSTVKYFKQAYPESGDMDATIEMFGHSKILDIVDLAVRPEFRGLEKMITPWLYYALYKYSVQTGIEYYISSINEHAVKNLGYLGVKFSAITPKTATYDSTDEPYGFYLDKTSTVYEGTVARRDELVRKSNRSEIAAALAVATQVAISGTTEVSFPDLQNVA